jgi:hypothetical protein
MKGVPHEEDRRETADPRKLKPAVECLLDSKRRETAARRGVRPPLSESRTRMRAFDAGTHTSDDK